MRAYRLEATLREATGKSASRRLRREGRIPAIVYGGGKQLPIALDMHQLIKPLNEEAFYTSIIELNIQGVSGKHTVLLKEVAWDPLREVPIHLDFHRVSAKDTVHVDVPVHPVGQERCPGLVKGGVLELIRHSLEVVCRVDRIPEAIEVDCSALDIGDVVHVEDLSLPEGVKVPHEVNFTVLTIAAPTAEAPTVEETTEESEAP